MRKFADLPDIVLGPLTDRSDAEWQQAPSGKWTPAQIVEHLALALEWCATGFEERRARDPMIRGDVEVEEIQIDHLSMALVWEPEAFDVLLLPNLYGDILSDLCAGLVGGLGLIPGANIGWEYAVFEPVHGSAPDIARKGLANPIAMILSGALMLRHLNERTAAERVERAVDAVLGAGVVRTPDLGGTSNTQDVGRAIAEATRG